MVVYSSTVSYKLRAAGLRLSVRGARRQHQKNRKDHFCPQSY